MGVKVYIWIGSRVVASTKMKTHRQSLPTNRHLPQTLVRPRSQTSSRALLLRHSLQSSVSSLLWQCQVYIIHVFVQCLPPVHSRATSFLSELGVGSTTMLTGEGVLVPTFKCQMWIYIVHSGKKKLLLRWKPLMPLYMTKPAESSYSNNCFQYFLTSSSSNLFTLSFQHIPWIFLCRLRYAASNFLLLVTVVCHISAPYKRATSRSLHWKQYFYRIRIGSVEYLVVRRTPLPPPSVCYRSTDSKIVNVARRRIWTEQRRGDVALC